MAKFRKQKNDTYGLSSPLISAFPAPIISTRAPAAGDTGHELGQVWVNTTTGQAWTHTASAAGAATWALSSPGASDVDTINSLSPVAGDILIDGGTNLTDVNAGNTVTLNLDPAITLATSVTSPLYTAAADVQISAPAGQDVIIQMGDAAGANVVSFTNSAAAQVFAIDSTGTLAMAGLTVTGALTQTAGIVNIGADAAANAINIGTGAAAKVVTIGSVTGAASLDLLAGTGNFSLEGNVATTYAISNVGVNTGQVDIAGGTGARTINIGGGGTGAKTINIGAAASADVITIGDATGAGSLDLACGTGNFTLEGNVASTYQISNTGANTGQVDVFGGTGARTVNIAGGGTGIKTINIGTAATADVISIGDGTGAGSLALVSGTGGTLVDSTGVIELNSSAAAIGIGSDADNFGINIGTAGVRTVALGSAAATAVTLDAIALSMDATAASNFTVTGAGADVTLASVGGSVVIDGSEAAVTAVGITASDAAGGITLTSGTAGIIADTTGNIELNSSAGTILIGDDDVDQNIEVGTDGERVVTVGSTNGAASLVLQAGTGEITMTGTVKQIDSELMGTTGVYIPTINMSPVMTTAATTGGVPTGATGDVNLMSLQNQAIMEQFILGAGQTIIAPRMSANGLLISLDLTATEGAEYNFGGALDSTFGFTVGTSGAFFFELDLYINDMDGADPYIFGFRKTEANNATFANYTDYYALGMNAGTSVTNIVIFDELNSGGQTITNTTDAWGGDGTTNTLRIDVSAAGVCTSYINGVIATAAPAFTFDADRVTPFIRLTHSASPTQVAITGMRIGLQA